MYYSNHSAAVMGAAIVAFVDMLPRFCFEFGSIVLDIGNADCLCSLRCLFLSF